MDEGKMDSKMNCDTAGRRWARRAEVKVGTVLETDGGSDCWEKEKKYVVMGDGGEGGGNLYFPCRAGRHYLDGQLSDDRSCYIGLYLCREEEEGKEEETK